MKASARSIRRRVNVKHSSAVKSRKWNQTGINILTGAIEVYEFHASFTIRHGFVSPETFASMDGSAPVVLSVDESGYLDESEKPAYIATPFGRNPGETS